VPCPRPRPRRSCAGEAELPFALVGYATDYANGVRRSRRRWSGCALIAASPDAFARLLAATVPRIDAGALAPPGIIYRFG
jgi:hypothetical protein